MGQLGPVFLGISGMILGVAFFALAFFLLRAVPRVQPVDRDAVMPPVPPGVNTINDAVLLIQSGGRVAYINQVAREWLGLLEEEPNLERLARRARPNQAFLGLCASEGQARFSLNGIFVEGTSYFIPYNESSAILVTFHRPQVKAITTDAGVTPELPETALDIFAELSQTMASSLDLTKTLQAVLESVERIIPSDFSEVTLWDADKKFLIPYRFVGLAGLDRHMERAEQHYNPKEGYTGFLLASRSPLMIGNVDAYRPVRPVIDRKQYPFNSYLGVPLLIGSEVIGTLEMASLGKDNFTQNDRELLRILSGQAAIAIHNALLYEEEQQRVLELSGLAQLAHAASALYDPQDLFGRLVDSIRPLLDVGVIGFWMFDDNKHALEAQAPFVGIPIQFLEHYSLSIAQDSRADEIWRKQEVVVTSDVENDERMQALGFVRIAQAAGYSSSALVPLSSGGRQLGYLQAASKKDGSPFDQNDLRLLTIVGSQAAIIIENAIMAKLNQKRAQRAEALRRIASLIGSAATRDEMLAFSLVEVGRLLNIDFAMIFLLDEHRGEMSLHKESVFGISADDIKRIGQSAQGVSEARALRIEGMKRSYITGNAREDTDILQAYRLYVDCLDIGSIIIAPLTIRDRRVGEVMIASRAQDSFDRNDAILVDTIAGQLASAIEQSSMSAGSDETLRRRVDQLTALNKMSRELNTSLDLTHLINRVYEELLHTTHASCGTILLFDSTEDTRSSRTIFLQVGDPHPTALSPLEQSVLEKEEPVVVQDYKSLDFGASAPHENIRSSLVVPIGYQEQIAGLIHLHARGVDRFDATAIDIAQSLAVQAAIAMGNSQRYEQQVERNELLSRRVETLSQLFQTTAALHVDQPLEESLENIAYGIQDSTPFTVILISVLDPDTRQLIRVASAGLTLEQQQEALSHKLPWQAVEQLMRSEFKMGRSYFIPADKSPILPPDVHFIYSTPVEKTIRREDAWHNDDFMLLPVVDASGSPLGIISVDNPRNGLRPDRPTIETLELFANQAALAIEGFKKLEVFKEEAELIRKELDRSKASAADTQAHLPAILHKDLEQTLIIQRLALRARRVRAGLEMAETLNRQPDRMHLLEAFGQEMVSEMDFDAVLVGEISEGAPRISQSLGAVPAGVNPESLLGQRNPLRQALSSAETILVSNLVESEEWRGSPLLQALDTRSFICIPVPKEDGESGKELEAVVLAVRQTPYEQFTLEDQQLYALMARQVSIALQNLRLLTETNRRLQEVNALLEFSRKLGSFDPRSILKTLADSALGLLPEANTCLVALWDAKQSCLVPQVASGYYDSVSMMEINYHAGEALPGQAYQKGETIRLAEVNFARDYQLPSENLIRYRNATQGKLPISTLIVPIGGGEASGQHTSPLGVLVLDSYKNAGAFSAEDAALVTSLAQQTALTLENARLYQASEQRAEQLRSLTDVASTITSSLQSSELIDSLLTQAQTIIPYETGTLWLRQGDRLKVQAARGFADSEERVGISVEVEDSRLLKEMISSGKPISVPDIRNDDRFPSLIEPTFMSWLGVPLVSKGQVVGVIALEKAEPGFYSPEHLQAVTTFAGQAAVALENAKLYEESVDRAGELNDRSQRLATLNRLSSELSGSMDPVYIVKAAAAELLKTAQCTAVSAILFDSDGNAWLQAEHPASGVRLPALVPAAPLFARLKDSLGILNYPDVTNKYDPDISTNLGPLADHLVKFKTKSLLVLPMATGSDLHGLIMLHNENPYHYTPDQIELLRTISNQVAVAVQNARLFGETRQRSAELATLYDLGVNVAQVFERQQLIDLTFKNVSALLGVESVALVLREEADELIGYLLDQGKALPPVPIPPSGTSFSQHVLATGTPMLIGDLQRDQESLPVPGFVVGDPSRSWIGVPLVVRGSAIGVLSVQSNKPDQFTHAHVRLLEQVSSQLAVALDNSRLFATVQNYAAELEQRVAERTSELGKEHHRTETLLGIITELSTSLDMDLVLNRTLTLINQSTGAQHSVIMLVNPENNFLFLRASLGYAANLPKGGRATKMKFNQGLAGWVISKRQSALVADLQEDERWIPNEEQPTDHRSAMAVPLMMGEEVLGALLLFNREPDMFSHDQLDLVQATAKQIAVSINNSSLYTLIRDQAERLGDMLRRQHVETSRSQAILEAVADGVLVTDANRVITLFNASAEQILGLSRQQVLGQTLENFVGLFGNEGKAWMETIRSWSEDPHSLGDGQAPIYTEQIETDDRHVVSVHLAPVRLRNDFLGTVSIFQDITHQVEVDRLKSEFVATVSHELRTPMTSIKGYVDVMLMGVAGSLSEQQQHFLTIVKSNTERLAILVNDLLDISRIEAGKVELSMQPVEMRDLILKATEDLTHRARDEGKQMEIRAQLPADPPRAFGDPDRIRQIIDNLLENAYIYTPENGEILISLSLAEEGVQVDVKDNGIGILPEEQERIFERFYRGEDPLVLASSGTGLGLSIVARLIEMHKGRIWVASEGVRGMGSTFSFTLPLY